MSGIAIYNNDKLISAACQTINFKGGGITKAELLANNSPHIEINSNVISNDIPGPTGPAGPTINDLSVSGAISGTIKSTKLVAGNNPGEIPNAYQILPGNEGSGYPYIPIKYTPLNFVTTNHTLPSDYYVRRFGNARHYRINGKADLIYPLDSTKSIFFQFPIPKHSKSAVCSSTMRAIISSNQVGHEGTVWGSARTTGYSNEGVWTMNESTGGSAIGESEGSLIDTVFKYGQEKGHLIAIYIHKPLEKGLINVEYSVEIILTGLDN